MAWAFCLRENDKGFTNCYPCLILENSKSYDIQTISAKIGLTSGGFELAGSKRFSGSISNPRCWNVPYFFRLDFGYKLITPSSKISIKIPLTHNSPVCIFNLPKASYYQFNELWPKI
jgi:hypothetical protein